MEGVEGEEEARMKSLSMEIEKRGKFALRFILPDRDLCPVEGGVETTTD